MTANLLKYVTARLTAAFLVFLFAGYTSMRIFYEQMGGEEYNPFLWIIIALLSLFIPSLFFSYVGNLRYNAFLIKAGEYDLTLQPDKAVKQFEKLLQFVYSFYFFPTTTERYLKKVYHEYSKLFLGLHSRTKTAQEIYEEAISRNPADVNLQNILISIFVEKDNLTKREIEISFLIFKHSSDNRQVVAILSNYYVEKDIFDFNTQEIFKKAIALKTGSREKVVDYLLLKLIELQREDDFAAEVFLSAYSDYSNSSEAVLEAIIKLYYDRKKRSNKDEISEKIISVYNKIPINIRKQLEDRVLETEKEKGSELPVKNKFKDSILGPFSNVVNFIKKTASFFKNKSFKFPSVKMPERSIFRKAPLIILPVLFLTALAFLFASLFNEEDKIKPAINLSNINPEYALYESNLPYSIQIAAFKTLSRAESFISRLAEHGEKAYYTKTSGKTIWYRARVGEFKTKKEAKIYAEKLLKKKLIKGYFISNFETGLIKRKK